MFNSIFIAIAFLILTSASFVLTKKIKHRRESLYLLDNPNERSSHSKPTASGGGISIALVIILVELGSWILFPNILTNVEWLIILLCGILIMGISWVDDINPVSSVVRYSIHSTVAILIIFFLGGWHQVTIPVLGSLKLGILSVPLTFIWITGLINIYNFMDGIDGIAGVQAIIAGIAWGYFSFGSEIGSIIFIVALGVVSSTSGFLFLNWHPAKIFMGDVGSAFLGYTFAIIPLMFNRFSGNSDALLLGVAAIWPFIFDGSLTIIRRLINGENIFKPHRSHMYQKLVIAGLRHDTVTLLYSIFMVLGLISGIILKSDKNILVGLTVLVLTGISMIIIEKVIDKKARGQISNV